MPVGHVVLKIYMPCKNFYVPSQYLYKPCKAYVYCWENKYMPRLKNHLPSWAHNHKSLGALGQDLRVPGMWARLNVEPCISATNTTWNTLGRLPMALLTLTHCGLVTPYSNINLGQHRLNIAWQRKVITWDNSDFSSMKFCRNHLRLISHEIPQPSIINFNLKIVYLKFHSNLQGCWLSVKLTYYQHRKSYCEEKTILGPSHFHNGISYTGKILLDGILY